MKAQLKQIIELLDADERLELLNTLMDELPPSAVKDAFENHRTAIVYDHIHDDIENVILFDP